VAASSLRIPKAPVVKPIAPGSATSKPDAPKTTVKPSSLPASLPKNASLYQRYSDPITGAKYQYVNGAWKMTSGATGAAHGRLPLTTPRLSGSESSGETISTPPTPPAPTASYDYSAGFSADPRYATGLANIAANQVGIGNEYGYVINRDTDSNSPTYGSTKWLAPGQEPGQGTITPKIDPTTGKSVYSDATGKVYNVNDLTLDIRELKPGEPGYLKGALGNAAATSANNQQTVGENAALAGVQRSGMRGSGVAMEAGALQGALSKLGLGAASAFRGTTNQYADLLNAIFPDQADKAAALASAGTTPAATATPEVTPIAPSAPKAESKNPIIGTPGKKVGEIRKNKAGVKYRWNGKKWILV